MEDLNTKMTTSQNFQIKKQRKIIGGAVDKHDISQKSSTSEHLDNINKEVKTNGPEKSTTRVFLETKKGKLCLGILLGILLCGIIAGNIIWYLLNWQCEKEKCQMSKLIKHYRKEIENQLAFDSIKCVEDVCYFFEEDKVTWSDASARCKKIGKFLAEVKTSGEADLMYTFTSDKTGVWLGGFEAKKGKWVWQETGETIILPGQEGFHNWTSNEPNDHGGNEACLHVMVQHKGWNDFNCDARVSYVCQSSKRIQ